MRYILFLLFIALVLSSCKKANNPVEPSTQPILSVSRIIDSSQYTLTIPKSIFGVRDTLEATLTELNLRTVPETLYVNTGNMAWTLKNDSGRVILDGPHIISNYVIEKIIAPHESTVIGLLWQPMPLMPVGSYVFSVGGYLDLSLRLSIQ